MNRIELQEFTVAFNKVMLHFGLSVKEIHFARLMARDQQARRIYLSIAKSL